jgi:D-alanyl-D-alanine carboxypeptidase (penicillin-binding protein 5/6)
MPLPPASLTKMMTSYILAREIGEGNVQETDMVAISENAWSQNPLFEGSSLMWIEPGKDVSIADLQRGVIISSGNDATVAVAEHLAGSEAVFVEMMNTQAEKLGMDPGRKAGHGGYLLPQQPRVAASRARDHRAGPGDPCRGHGPGPSGAVRHLQGARVHWRRIPRWTG